LKMALIRRAASLSVECERLEGRLADGDEKVDVDMLARMSSHLRRIGETIGFARVRRERTVTLDEILTQHEKAHTS
jgi:hypothetical protein